MVKHEPVSAIGLLAIEYGGFARNARLRRSTKMPTNAEYASRVTALAQRGAASRERDLSTARV